jgi:hypothetical protein
MDIRAAALGPRHDVIGLPVVAERLATPLTQTGGRDPERRAKTLGTKPPAIGHLERQFRVADRLGHVRRVAAAHSVGER